MRPLPALTLLLLCLSLSFTSGCGGDRELSFFVHGPPYPRPRCAKGEAKLGSVHGRGKPVANARIRLIALGPKGESTQKALEAKTDAAGHATLRGVGAGRYKAVVIASGFRVEPGMALSFPEEGSGPEDVEITLHPCLSAGKNRYAVGFEERVSLAAQNRCGRSWNTAKLRWTQVEGPDAKASFKGENTRQLSFTTAPLKATRKLPVSPQILSFSHDEAGQYVFRLVAENERGQRSESHVMVTATSVTNGMTSVPPYDTYIFAGRSKGPWQWELTQKPRGWKVKLRGETTRTPSVTPVPNGPVAIPQNVGLINRHSGLRFSIVLGAWDTVRRDCGRPDCHFSLEEAWKKTPHAQAWKRLLDGELKLKRGPAAEGCAECHATGRSPTANIGGYDDAARRARVKVPLRQAKGTYDKLPQKVKDVSNVYCLACHGPGRLDPPIAEQPGLFGVGVCARCHDRLPEQTLVYEWRKAKHSKTVTNKINGPATRAECARCHSAQGFYYGNFAIARPHSTRTAILNCCKTTRPITCQACHNPMRATARKQIYRFGAVKTGSGLSLDLVGSAALCASCHNADNDPSLPETLEARLAPHAPQADLTYGRAGYALPVKAPIGEPKGRTCVTKTKDGCVTCHMHAGPKAGSKGHLAVGGHTFLTTSSKEDGRIENVRACVKCHADRRTFDAKAKGDFDGDGKVELERAEVRGLLTLLKEKIEAQIGARSLSGCDVEKSPAVSFARGTREKIVLIDAKKRDLGDCDKNGLIEREEQAFTFAEADLLLHKAAYNYLVVARDGSFGLHNYPYAVRLLQRSIAALGGALPAWTAHR